MQLKRKMMVECGAMKSAAALWIVGTLLTTSARAETFASTMYDTIKGNYVESLALIPACTLLGLLAIIVGLDAYIRPESKKTMRVIIAVVFSLVAQNYMEYLLADGEVRWLTERCAGWRGR